MRTELLALVIVLLLVMSGLFYPAVLLTMVLGLIIGLWNRHQQIKKWSRK